MAHGPLPLPLTSSLAVKDVKARAQLYHRMHSQNYTLLIEREEVVEDRAGNEDILSHDDSSVKTMGMSCYSA